MEHISLENMVMYDPTLPPQPRKPRLPVARHGFSSFQASTKALLDHQSPSSDACPTSLHRLASL